MSKLLTALVYQEVFTRHYYRLLTGATEPLDRVVG